MNQSLSSPSDLGPILKDLDDTYTCYARNMFRHFTGVRVELFDPGDPSQSARIQAMSAKDWAYLTFVTKLGKDLREKNKARVVLEEIMKSDFYRSSDALAGGSQ